jgi:putative dimethyl sulfoxide reductase chaperone
MTTSEMHSNEEPKDPNSLSAVEIALARSRTYDFFSRLYRQGPTQQELPLIRAIPELAETLTDPFDAEQQAATYQTIFGFNVFPYESAFMEPSGSLGGEISDAILHRYALIGFAVDANTEASDHIATELALLAVCSQQAASLWDAGDIQGAHHLRDWQQHFLADHLLRWIAPFAQAVRAEADPFYTELVEMTMALVVYHYADLSDGSAPLQPFELPPSPKLLGEEETGLKEIADYLISPLYSGIFLSRDAIGRLARQANLPRGFGGRRQMLTNLLRAAAQYEQFPALMAHLDALVQSWITGYQADALAYPPLEGFILPWVNHATITQGMLAEIGNISES